MYLLFQYNMLGLCARVMVGLTILFGFLFFMELCSTRPLYTQPRQSRITSTVSAQPPAPTSSRNRNVTPAQAPVPVPAPAPQRPAEPVRPGAFRIKGTRKETLPSPSEFEELAVANVVPQALAEPIVESPRFFKGLRRIFNRHDIQQDKTIAVEVLPEDQMGTLASVAGQEYHVPEVINAKKVWF
jgi:hypothetical protein